MAGNLKSPSLHPMNPKLGEGPRFNSTERWVMRRSSTRWGTATVEKRRSRARWGTETVQKRRSRARWGTETVQKRRSRARWGTATVQKRRSRTRWGTATVEKSPVGRRPCVVRTLCGRNPSRWWVGVSDGTTGDGSDCRCGARGSGTRAVAWS